MQNKTGTLEPEAFYHIYNRANGNENIFFKDENYLFFLKKYKEYISPICNTYCYCLMPNHFHFLIEIKNEEELKSYFKNKDLTGFQNLSGLVSKEFSNFFNAYSKSINKQEGRKGSLFMRPFKRKKIEEKSYLFKLVHYIHFNPKEAGLVKKIEEWKYSSYHSLLSNSPTLLERETVINWFNDSDNFRYLHLQKPEEIKYSFD